MADQEENLDESSEPQESAAKFGLNEPTGQFQDLKARLERESELANEEAASLHENEPAADESDSIKYRNMGWKGIDDDVDDGDDDDLGYTGRPKEPIPEDELDMTPMVDVTFLLLIFFMVTASFTIQKSLEQAHAKSDEPSFTPTEELETPDDYVEILIDQTNTFYVTSRSEDEVECPSDSEMRSKVKDAFDNEGARRLVIVAHVDSLHRKVVTAWDTGTLNNASEIEIQTTEEDY